MTNLLWFFTIIFGLIAIFSWWKGRTTRIPIQWHIRLNEALFLDDYKRQGPPVTLHLTGELPKNMSLNNSYAFCLKAEATTNPSVDFEFPRGSDAQIDLVAAGFDKDPDGPQRKHIPDLGSVSFSWSLRPKQSGFQQLLLTASWIDEDRRSFEVGTTIHKVKVEEFAGLTSRQLQRVAFLSGILSVVSLIVTIADKLIGWLVRSVP